MKGNNELHFNQATMILAAQHYLEKIMNTPVPKVTSVKQVNTGNYPETFVIKVESDDESTIGPA